MRGGTVFTDDEEREEVAVLARRLASHPWLVGGREDDAIGTSSGYGSATLRPPSCRPRRRGNQSWTAGSPSGSCSASGPPGHRTRPRHGRVPPRPRTLRCGDRREDRAGLGSRSRHQHPDAHPDLTCPGLGPIAGNPVRIAGLFGGGLHSTTPDGWTLDIVSPEWPHDRVIRSADGGAAERPDEQFVYETKTFGALAEFGFIDLSHGYSGPVALPEAVRQSGEPVTL